MLEYTENLKTTLVGGSNEINKAFEPLSEQMVFRNGAFDMPGMKRDLYKFICEGFDELQDDFSGVSKQDMMSYVMRKCRGHFNPQVVLEAISEFNR